MNRLYIALSLISAAIIICCISTVKTEKSSQLMLNELEEISVMITGDTDKALERLEKTQRLWDDTQQIFSFIVDADKIEEMNIGISMIQAHLNDGNTEHALERLRECEFILKEIAANEKTDIKNIM